MLLLVYGAVMSCSEICGVGSSHALRHWTNTFRIFRGQYQHHTQRAPYHLFACAPDACVALLVALDLLPAIPPLVQVGVMLVRWAGLLLETFWFLCAQLLPILVLVPRLVQLQVPELRPALVLHR